MDNKDEPAYPVETLMRGVSTGLTKREHFAGLAMQQITNREFDADAAAVESVYYADALLKELEKENA